MRAELIVGPARLAVGPVIGHVKTGAFEDNARWGVNPLRIDVTVGTNGRRLVAKTTGYAIENSATHCTSIFVNWHLPDLPVPHQSDSDKLCEAHMRTIFGIC